MGVVIGSAPTTLTWDKVYETTLTAAAQAIDITGLDIATNQVYILFLNMKSGAAHAGLIYLYNSGDYTTNHYYSQTSFVNNNAYTALRNNTPEIGSYDNADNSIVLAYIWKDSANYFRCIAFNNWKSPSAVRIGEYCTSNGTAAATLTSLRLYASGGADDFAVGTYVCLGKPR